MILVDTSVWVDHLRKGGSALPQFLDAGEVLSHPFVIGELALGYLEPRGPILEALQKLPSAVVASHLEVLQFIEQHRLFERGVGYVDVHLLASTRLTASATLWTRDKRLFDAAKRLALAANL